MKIKLLILIVSMSFCTNFLVAQNIIDKYNEWLKQNQIDTFIKAEKYGFDSIINTYKLTLLVKEKNNALAREKWLQIDSVFRTTKHISLPKALYMYLAYLTGKTDSLKIYITNKSAFQLAIKKDTILTWGMFTRGKNDNSIIFDYNIKLNFKVQNSYQAKSTLAKLNKALSDFYQNGGFYHKYSTDKIRIEEIFSDDNTLILRVLNLRNEVLNQQPDDWVCSFLKWILDDPNFCDFSPWEYLEFRFYYNSNENKINFNLIGKVSSGIFDPINWNQAKSMNDWLDDYLNDYKIKIFNYLKHKI